MAVEAVKYDTLPFIDSSGQDCFESGNDIQQPVFDKAESTNECIENISLNHSKSFNVFQNKYLNSDTTDFSDKLSPCHKSGFESKSVYEIIGEQIAKETPHQKYERLKTELSELSEEIQQVKDSEAGQSPVTLSQHVKALQKQLHDLHLEKVLGPEVTATGGIQEGSWTRQIKNQLEAFKSKSNTEKEGNSTDNVVYEMYYRPEHAKYSQAAKISDLERKLKEVETIIGKNTTKFQSIVAENNVDSLMEAASSIQAKLSLFDISHIDIIAARLQGLLHCINEVSEKKETIDNVENQTKIAELHDLIKSWDSVATVIPDLIERLKALQSLNEQATTFSQSLDYLTSTQTEVRDQLRSQKQSIDKFEKSFDENVQSIQTNCTSIETRINALSKKIGTK